jgi:hypothetical protein
VNTSWHPRSILTDLWIAVRDEGTESALGVQGGDTEDIWLTRCMYSEMFPYESCFVAMKLPCAY